MLRRKVSRREPREAYEQGKYLMPVSLIERVKEATRVQDLQYPAHFVIRVLEEACDDILGERDNPNPDAKRLLEINEEIGGYSNEIAEILFGGTSSGAKLRKWLDGLDESIRAGIIPESKREYYEDKIRDRVKKVHKLTLKRDKIRDKLKKKKKKGSKKILSSENLARVLKKRIVRKYLTNVPTVKVSEKKIAKGLKRYDFLKRRGLI